MPESVRVRAQTLAVDECAVAAPKIDNGIPGIPRDYDRMSVAHGRIYQRDVIVSSLADFYDEEVETAVSRFITLIEPALLVMMGIVIAAIVLALYMPLFQLTSVIGNR